VAGRGGRPHDRDELHEVRGDRLRVAARGDSRQQPHARQHFDDCPGAALRVPGAPAHAIAADHPEPPALQPAMDALAVLADDGRVATVARDHASCQ
jgi:hypothetical protein